MIDSSWKFLSSFEDFPSGTIRHIRLLDGLELVFCNFHCDRNVRHIFTLDNAPIEFAFHLAGHGNGEIIHTPWRREVVTAGPETAIFSFNPESVCRINVGEKQTLRVVNIYLSADRLRRMFEDEPDHLPRDLRRVLDASIPKPCNNVRPLHPRCRVILDQIYNCRYIGAFRRLYLESKAVELLVLQLEAWQHDPAHTNRKIGSDDVARIRAARDLLVRHTDKPPTLAELARKIGMNETKLKREFQQVFGATVHGYARNHRLDQSREMLAQGRLTVTEIAHQFDFYDATHFIKHFKRRFGVTPGTYIKLST
jgi:AraC-like DNA-binding protein